MPRSVRIIAIAVLSASLCIEAHAEPTAWRNECGVRCVYAVAEYFGIDVDYASLPSKYISSHRGSSMIDLVEALEDCGLQSSPQKGLRFADLVRTPCPVIIQVRFSAADMEENHFQVVLPGPDETVYLVDPVRGVAPLAPEALAGKWEGLGIAVSTTTVAPLGWGANDYAERLALFAALLFLSIGFDRAMLGLVRRFGVEQGSPVLSGLVIVTLASCLAGAASVAGIYPRDWRAVNEIQKGFGDTFLERVDKRQVKSHLAVGGLIIDARMPGDFAAGHIGSSINIAPSLELEGIAGRLESQSREGPVIIYCQSSGCPFAGKVARALLLLGFKELAIYKEGWNDWSRPE